MLKYYCDICDDIIRQGEVIIRNSWECMKLTPRGFMFLGTLGEKSEGTFLICETCKAKIMRGEMVKDIGISFGEHIRGKEG